jgi:hypothetical protein
MENVALVEICAKLEDLIYSDALAEYSLSQTASVWDKKDCIIYYQEKCEKLKRNLEFKTINWKKLFDDNERNPRLILTTILRDESVKKAKPMNPKLPSNKEKAPRTSKSKVSKQNGTTTDSSVVKRKSIAKKKTLKNDQETQPSINFNSNNNTINNNYNINESNNHQNPNNNFLSPNFNFNDSSTSNNIIKANNLFNNENLNDNFNDNNNNNINNDNIIMDDVDHENIMSFGFNFDDEEELAATKIYSSS